MGIKKIMRCTISRPFSHLFRNKNTISDFLTYKHQAGTKFFESHKSSITFDDKIL